MAGGTEAGTGNLRAVFAEVAQRLGRTPEDVEPYEAILRDNWYDDLQSLATLSSKELQDMGIPLRFAKELVSASAHRSEGSSSGTAEQATAKRKQEAPAPPAEPPPRPEDLGARAEADEVVRLHCPEGESLDLEPPDERGLEEEFEQGSFEYQAYEEREAGEGSEVPDGEAYYTGGFEPEIADVEAVWPYQESEEAQGEGLEEDSMEAMRVGSSPSRGEEREPLQPLGPQAVRPPRRVSQRQPHREGEAHPAKQAPGKDRGKGRDKGRGKGFDADKGRSKNSWSQDADGKGCKGGKSGKKGMWKKPEQYSFYKSLVIPTFRGQPGFPWKERILGARGENMRHVVSATARGIWLQLWGQGSGFKEIDTGKESSDPLQLSIHGGVNVTEQEFKKAVTMCEDLIKTVSQECRTWSTAGGRGSRERRRSLPRSGNHGNSLALSSGSSRRVEDPGRMTRHSEDGRSSWRDNRAWVRRSWQVEPQRAYKRPRV